GSIDRENVISENSAIAIAETWIRNNKSNGCDYVYDSCVYEESGGYYDIQFFLPVQGCKSDDIVRLWVDLQGNINAYSDFNQNRYSMIMFTPEMYANAQMILAERLDTMYTDCVKEVYNTYVSKNDAGETVLVMEVLIKQPICFEGSLFYSTFGERFEQPIE
ncbi:MAG: hypothetical protein J5649_10235, partial [Lachnospiraceae bacterium]|nr:hypothetical protein [Lachnospiraceae bacterium]